MANLFSRVFLLISLLICGCKETAQKQKAEQIPGIIVNNRSDWGGNVMLHILNREVTDSLYIYRVVSSDNNIPIGFLLEVPVYTNKFGEGIRFVSLGDTSDNFLKKLSEIYQVKLSGDAKFISSISCNYASLNELAYKGDGQKRDSSINYLKLFFEGSGEDDYAELYLNIDENAKTIEFEEKDIEFRQYVIGFLTAH